VEADRIEAGEMLAGRLADCNLIICLGVQQRESDET
jgi:hypothetical protein